MRKYVMMFLPLVAMSAPAFALDLQTARAQSLVCERSDGMLAVKSGGHAEVKALVDSVNEGRRAEYDRIAASKGQSVAVVGQITAKELIGKGNAACR